MSGNQSVLIEIFQLVMTLSCFGIGWVTGWSMSRDHFTGKDFEDGFESGWEAGKRYTELNQLPDDTSADTGDELPF